MTIQQPAADHPFRPSYTGMVCEQMVLVHDVDRPDEPGYGDQCGLPAADHPRRT